MNVAPDKNKWLALMSKLMNFWVPLNAGKFVSVGGTVLLSKRVLLHGIIESLLYCFNLFEDIPQMVRAIRTETIVYATTVISESSCALTKSVGTDVHKRLFGLNRSLSAQRLSERTVQ
jgi:hypothetical protein